MITRRKKTEAKEKRTGVKASYEPTFVDELEKIRMEKIKNGELVQSEINDGKLGKFITTVSTNKADAIIKSADNNKKVPAKKSAKKSSKKK